MYVPTDDLKRYKEEHPEAYKGIFPEEPSVHRNKALMDIESLDDNWNHNGAKHFSKDLIEKCEKMLPDFHVTPAIFPTAAESIQMEWEKENGDYLEIEVFLDRCVVFKRYNNGDCSGYEATDKELKNIVKDFFDK